MESVITVVFMSLTAVRTEIQLQSNQTYGRYCWCINTYSFCFDLRFTPCEACTHGHMHKCTNARIHTMHTEHLDS